ncbi:imidazolonepropionase [Bowmanella yangjiangensis]|uniref:Imidazolonepropionase n=1 Tax=Bowmanella yangjiangensis TaxID=2811230 RepID=A0ABS3CQ61_9ALTE|nr:imidazolonepropionase [Bowmanella yangjiangensis]MBN7819227.1 imidazolonepropionase [Bowmanella yangjiangensis]
MSDTHNADLLITNINLATFDPALGPYGIIEQGALLVAGGHIQWLGKQQDLPKLGDVSHAVDGQGQWLLPGFIDCHTHLVFAGNRADEFEQRLQGVSYTDIAKQGGGIRRTVSATREASEAQLLTLALKRAEVLLAQGVTCIEVKSGYGLDVESELKLLRVARQIGKHLPLTIQTTFLGAHALPAEYQDDAQGYIDLVCQHMLPLVAEQQLADAVDVFCENIGFTLAQTQQVFDAAKQLGLPVKLHAEQLSNLGGSALAADYQALSVDHIEFLDEAGVKAIAQSGTVATLLPGAFYYLRETQKPPIDLLRQYQVPMAVATDFNPGTSPILNLQLMLNMACTLFALTPEEALQGVTQHAAKALGLQNTVGMLKAGMQADMQLLDISHPNQLAYQIGGHPLTRLWQAGKPVKGGQK